MTKKETIFLSKSVKLTLEVFLGYSYDLAYFHPDILIEAILIKKKRVMADCVLKIVQANNVHVLFIMTFKFSI